MKKNDNLFKKNLTTSFELPPTNALHSLLVYIYCRYYFDIINKSDSWEHIYLYILSLLLYYNIYFIYIYIKPIHALYNIYINKKIRRMIYDERDEGIKKIKKA